jgi:signal transduction histidine kinase
MTIFSISGLFIAGTSLILTFILLIYGRSKLHRIWTLLNIAVLVWGVGCFLAGRASSPVDALNSWRIAISGGLFIGVFFYHMVYIFSETRKKGELITVYAVGVCFFLLTVATEYTLTNWHLVFDAIYYPGATVLYGGMVASWVVNVYFGLMVLNKTRRDSKGIKRIQAKYLLLAFLIGFIGGGPTLIPAFHLNIYPIGNFGIPVYTFIVTYAILRHRLMDIHLVIKKGMVYSLSAGIMASLFVILVLTMTEYVENVAGLTSHAITIIPALTIAVLFNPLKNSLQKIIDNTFYKRTYNYFDVIRDISRKLTTMFEMNTINEFIANTIFDTLGLNSIYVLTAASGRNCEVVYQRFNKHTKKKELNIAEQGNLANNSELIRFMIESEDILINDELPAFEKKIGQDGIQKIRREIELFGGEVAAPVFIEGQLALILILGEKLSGDMFTREDINLLNTILASIGMMSATFAHEVRNPLTSLKTFAQLMPEKYNDEEFRDGFSKIVVGEIQKIDDLISDLLDFSEEKKSARISEYDLVGIVDETIDYVKGKLGLATKNIVIETKYASESVIMIGDVKQLRQLFTNLVTNGCQAIKGEGTLRVEIRPDGDNVNIAITDTGKGIHPDEIQIIFDPFVTSKEAGTGLGLPISKKIVEEHNGSLHVESTLSEGSTFTVTLPVQK